MADVLTICTGNFKLANNTSSDLIFVLLPPDGVGGDEILYRMASSVNGDDVLDDELGIRRLRRENTLSCSGAVFFEREPRSRLHNSCSNVCWFHFFFRLVFDPNKTCNLEMIEEKGIYVN